MPWQACSITAYMSRWRVEGTGSCHGMPCWGLVSCFKLTRIMLMTRDALQHHNLD